MKADTRAKCLYMVGLLALCLSASVEAQTTTRGGSHPGAQLHDIVGTWQSDTVGGVSALSACAPSPDGESVICDQLISSAAGVQHAMSFFIPDSAGAFVFYNLARPGTTMRPVKLVITNHAWTYGGTERSDDGRFYRTVNVFSGGATYAWRQESSADGITWVTGVQGHSRRVR